MTTAAPNRGRDRGDDRRERGVKFASSSSVVSRIATTSAATIGFDRQHVVAINHL